METFSALLALCVGNSPVPGEFPSQRPVTQSFDVFFHLGLNKRLSKQSWGCWFEMTSWSLWRHCNASAMVWTCDDIIKCIFWRKKILSLLLLLISKWTTITGMNKMFSKVHNGCRCFVYNQIIIFNHIYDYIYIYIRWFKFHWSLFLRVLLTFVQRHMVFLVSNELPRCSLMTPYGGAELGRHWHGYNGLLPDGTKTLPEPMLTYHQ